MPRQRHPTTVWGSVVASSIARLLVVGASSLNSGEVLRHHHGRLLMGGIETTAAPLPPAETTVVPPTPPPSETTAKPLPCAACDKFMAAHPSDTCAQLQSAGLDCWACGCFSGAETTLSTTLSTLCAFCESYKSAFPGSTCQQIQTSTGQNCTSCGSCTSGLDPFFSSVEFYLALAAVIVVLVVVVFVTVCLCRRNRATTGNYGSSVSAAMQGLLSEPSDDYDNGIPRAANNAFGAARDTAGLTAEYARVRCVLSKVLSTPVLEYHGSSSAVDRSQPDSCTACRVAPRRHQRRARHSCGRVVPCR
jgi:hypothetical protein